MSFEPGLKLAPEQNAFSPAQRGGKKRKMGMRAGGARKFGMASYAYQLKGGYTCFRSPL